MVEKTMNLSTNFTLEELTVSEIAARRNLDNTPNATEVANLVRVAELLEQVRALLGKPILVNSAFRSKPVNDAVGSRDTSQHRLGCAADIRVPGLTPKQVVQACIDANIPFDQIIEEFDSWTHISVPNTKEQQPRRQALVINKAGTRPFL
jgi:zinc D-Ala-D-Ala carboxypeptidase